MEAHSPHCTSTTLSVCVTACMYLCKPHVRTSKNEIGADRLYRAALCMCPDMMFAGVGGGSISLFGEKKTGTKLTNKSVFILFTLYPRLSPRWLHTFQPIRVPANAVPASFQLLKCQGILSVLESFWC